MPEAETGEKPGERLTFMQHLEELRRRLVYAAVAVVGGFFLCYSQIERIFRWLVRPLRQAMPDSPLVMIRLTEGVMTYLKLALWAGLLLSSPFVLYQIWAFVAPGLYKNEKRLIPPLVITSSILFVAGAAFTYYLALPLGLKYLMTFSTEDVKAMLSMSSYVSFTCLFMALFGLIFQVPLIMLVLGRVGIVKAGFLAKNRKYVFLGSFIIGAIFTPPDVLSQVLMSVPLFLLFELSIWLMRLQDLLRRRKKEAAATETSPAG